MFHFRFTKLISKLGFFCFNIRLTVYPPTPSHPGVEVVSERNLSRLLEIAAAQTYQYHVECGGKIPLSAIKEIVDNLIHADLCNGIITIFADGSGIRVTDQGCGISHKDLATQPGFSTANSWHCKYIRGIGSGLAQATTTLYGLGGRLEISDNLETGTVVTLYCPQTAYTREVKAKQLVQVEGSQSGRGESDTDAPFGTDDLASLSDRQRSIITVLNAHGPLGPSKIAEYIKSSPSSAYRDMVVLTEAGFLMLVDGGRRMISSRVGKQIFKSIGDK